MDSVRNMGVYFERLSIQGVGLVVITIDRIIELELVFRAESTFIWTIVCESIVSLHSLSFLFQLHYFTAKTSKGSLLTNTQPMLDIMITIRTCVMCGILYHLIFQKQAKRADDTISIVVHWMVFTYGRSFLFILCTVPNWGGYTVV
jgi:ABC-type microcin C transport system permease subunit YejE